MQIKFRPSGIQAAPKQPTREELPPPPDGEAGDVERTYEDRQDAAFDPKGDRAPDEDDDTVVRKSTR